MRNTCSGSRLPVRAGIAAALVATVMSASAAGGDTVFATIDDIVISQDEFDREVYAAARQTYYHGRPPGRDEYIEFRKDVADRLIDRHLLLREAKRRDMKPDDAAVDTRLAAYEARYGGTERWQAEGSRILAALRTRIAEDNVLDALEAQVRTVSAPGPAELREYYESNPALFTEPARRRVSVILLAVEPSAGPAVWQAARDEARRIMRRLQEGMPFADVARMHSSDPSAAAGGDMGYLHQGMLSAGAEAAIDALAVDQVSEPVQVLEGIALFKLTDTRPARQRSFDDVQERAAELWLREQGERKWQALVADLRSGSHLNVDAAYLVSLPESAQ